MKTIKTKFAIAAAIILGGSAAVLGFTLHPWNKPALASRPAAVVSSKKQAVAPPAVPEVPPQPESSPTPAPSVAAQPTLSASPSPKIAKAKPPGSGATPKGAPKPPKPPLSDPLAREALSYVGVDPMANMYWVSAINDPGIPAEERKDLIEDLNEEGFSDRKNLSQEDVPIIMNRLHLIEELAPYSADQVNADAFQEAYKDLVNMLDRAP